MPNHIKNILKFNRKKYPNIFEELLDKDGDFDFNKLIPMPERLMLIEGSITNIAIKYVKLIDENKFLDEKQNLEEQNKNFIKSLKNNEPIEDYREIYKKYDIKNLYDLGKLYLKNEKEYGCHTWYDWCIKNWGTKWNAYEQQHLSNKFYNIIIFETAWSYPRPIIEKLAEKYDFTLYYADEDIGYNCGKIDFVEGTKYISNLKNSNDFANKVWRY